MLSTCVIGSVFCPSHEIPNSVYLFMWSFVNLRNIPNRFKTLFKDPVVSELYIFLRVQVRKKDTRYPLNFIRGFSPYKGMGGGDRQC